MTATFKIKNVFQIKNRNFFILGELVSGKIKKGMIIDLSVFGIVKKHKIENIEFALQREEGKTWDDIALGITSLTDDEKEIIKSQILFSRLIAIEE